MVKNEISRLENITRPGQSSSTQSNSERAQPSPSTPGSTGYKYQGSIVELVLLLAQLFSIISGVMFIFITNPYESRIVFQRCIFSALLTLLGTAVVMHGLPSLSTAKKLWRAFRNKATQQEMKQIANFAMDNNTHSIFYCSLILSSAPSHLLLIPLFLEVVVSLCRRVLVLAARAPSWASSFKGGFTSLADRVLARDTDIRRMIGNAEVFIFFALILQLFTSSRNILLLILYGQLLRVRYIVNADCKAAWNTVAQRADGVFLHARCPGPIRSLYNRIKSFAVGLVSQAPRA
mmetsp:Transcript_44217/g.117933  ORF Transcript_44217/g.117933 Transcript_44217/m.117933 type:complete len:291 (-) Transcript_44217:1145-2017(-)